MPEERNLEEEFKEIDQEKLEKLFEDEDENLEEVLEENISQGGVDQFSQFLSNSNKASVLEKVENFEEPINLEQEILNVPKNNFSMEKKPEVENKPIYSAEVEEIYRLSQNPIEPPVLKSEFRQERNNLSRIDLLNPMRVRSGVSTFSEPELLKSKKIDNSKYTSIKD